MKSLREPLLQAQLDQGRISPLWLFATETMLTLHALLESLPDFLLFNPLKKNTQINSSQFNESRACLAYLLFVQGITVDHFPVLFSPVFLLQCNMEYISLLLSRYALNMEYNCIFTQALHEKSLDSVQDNSLPVGLLEVNSVSSGLQNLRQVLTDCPMKHLRESGLQGFQLFINKLDAEAKHKFFRCMLTTSNHSGVEDYIIKNIRSQVELSMKLGNSNKWFQGVEFVTLLGLAVCLPQGAETDLLHSLDRIMECLNLLRYLLIRGNELQNNTDVWTELCRIKDEYLKMLRVCISMSRAAYTAELEAMKCPASGTATTFPSSSHSIYDFGINEESDHFLYISGVTERFGDI
ncbi:hypothetical protein LDENG_00113110 [Lucifuga dentata]|nr:hypothetical protein LDENG_00113110 [Lucifuga dentata]